MQVSSRRVKVIWPAVLSTRPSPSLRRRTTRSSPPVRYDAERRRLSAFLLKFPRVCPEPVLADRRFTPKRAVFCCSFRRQGLLLRHTGGAGGSVGRGDGHTPLQADDHQHDDLPHLAPQKASLRVARLQVRLLALVNISQTNRSSENL